MTMFLTPRLRKLMGLPEPEDPHRPLPPGPPRCCDKAQPDMCFCDAPGWRCPDHGNRRAPCIPGNTHD
ncbi:hypothetical protein F0U60_37490 [Archangium minus]|uniref:Uncharacterized protein n=1 Tax=Archangium minus TaxID=83450 RepID=A0ABY9X198_9BACT|nr:hypothetical protein F0U60_37490 [Archangium minus]